MNISELLGAMVQTGMSPSAGDRMRKSLGGGGSLDSLAGLINGPPSIGGGLGGALSGLMGGSSPKSGGIMDMLSGMLGDAGRAVGGNKNLAVGGLGALVGALMGGGKRSLGGAVGGGVMALLGAMAVNAIKSSGQAKPRIPLGLAEPETEAEKEELERNAEIILRAMINAAKSDGRIDQGEVDRITGKLREIGVDDEARNYVMTRMRQPMETNGLIAAAQGQPELAAEIYGASLLAIEVDTPAEKNYLDQLADGLGLSRQVTARIQELVGLRPA